MTKIAYQFGGQGAIVDPIPSKLKRIVTSATFLLGAFMLTQLIVQLYIYTFTTLLGYETQFGYHWVVAKPFAWDMWGNVRVVMIYAMPPIICLVLAYITQFVFINYSSVATRSKLFFLWLQTCLINLLLTQLFILPVGSKGSLTGFYQTFSIVATWFRVEGVYFLPVTILAAVLAVLWGIFIAPQLQTFSFSARLIQTKSGKDAMSRQVYVFPLLLAAPFIILFSNQYSFFVHVISVALMGLIYVGVIIRHRTDASVVMCSKEDFLNALNWKEIVAVMALWAVIIVFFNR